MRATIAFLFLGCVAGCATIRAPREGSVICYPGRSFADWSPDKAIPEAEHDISVGTPKVYLSGTIVAFTPGVDSADYPLVSSLPKADAGIGCLISDSDLRKAQFEYASRYNGRIVQHLKQKSNQAPAPTARAVTSSASQQPRQP